RLRAALALLLFRLVTGGCLLAATRLLLGLVLLLRTLLLLALCLRLALAVAGLALAALATLAAAIAALGGLAIAIGPTLTARALVAVATAFGLAAAGRARRPCRRDGRLGRAKQALEEAHYAAATGRRRNDGSGRRLHRNLLALFAHRGRA